MRIVYQVKIWKEKPRYKKEFCYFAETTSIGRSAQDARTANLEGKDVGASQYEIPALAFYLGSKMKRLNEQSGNRFFFEISFPSERSMGVDETGGSLRFGLSDQEIEIFSEALNDPDNPDPHCHC